MRLLFKYKHVCCYVISTMQFSGITSGAKNDGLSGGSLPTGVCVCVRVYVCTVHVCYPEHACFALLHTSLCMYVRICVVYTVYSARNVVCCTYVRTCVCIMHLVSTHADIEEGLVEPPAKKSKPAIL